MQDASFRSPTAASIPGAEETFGHERGEEMGSMAALLKRSREEKGISSEM